MASAFALRKLSNSPLKFSQLMYELNRAESTAYVGNGDYRDGSSPPIEGKQGGSSFIATLTYAEADNIVSIFQSTDHSFPVIEGERIRSALKEGGSRKLSDLKCTDPHLYALILTVCASTLISLPHSYAISLGIVEKGGDLLGALLKIDEEAQEALNLSRKPTIELISCRALFQLKLAP